MFQFFQKFLWPPTTKHPNDYVWRNTNVFPAQLELPSETPGRPETDPDIDLKFDPKGGPGMFPQSSTPTSKTHKLLNLYFLVFRAWKLAPKGPNITAQNRH